MSGGPETTRQQAPAPTPSSPVAGFDAVYRSERAAVLRLATLLVRSDAVAEELVQEAFLRLHRHFEDVDNPPGFVRTAVVRLASTWRSRAAMERDRLDRLPVVDAVAPGELDETWDALGRLKPERATVLVLRFYEDLSQEEIARLLGCSAGTVRSRVRRGLADLRKELAP
ncbi:MAG TPA: sigma-70 family RNA polymerase sigma factor [Acidimicrobiales bacterium]|nr:sigma-70 family RNA polymerase sigma factor [Acidimicrobiales bacterium]